MLSLLYRTDTSATQATTAADASAEVLTKRAQAERVYADLSAKGAPVSAGQLSAAAGLSASYARDLIAQFHARPPTALEANGHRPVPAAADPEAGPMTAAPADRAAALEHAWAAIRRHHPDVRQAVIVVASGSDPHSRRLYLGHFAAGQGR